MLEYYLCVTLNNLITVEPWVFCWCIYDVTDESCVNNIRNWIRYIEQHASDNVHKILVGNKADMDESKRVEHRYRQYHTQMHLVISWFEQSTGVGFVKLYTRHSLASSDHFQENSGVSSKSLGKEDSQGGKMEGSRLKFIDNHLKQQKFLGSWE
ncbi:ras-related protein RAB1BV-like isoform X2 [Daucus carota subsp. sativus]|uniref:ras-related protein RAB1BV-like isoform X2 n=1 Tax=Daucus carota subsp. sativus TaxID=79200 RepID=UPI0030834584